MAFLPQEEQDALVSRLSLDGAGPRAIITPPNRLGEGVYAVGVSVLDGQGHPVASLGIATLAFQNSLIDLENFVPLLQGAAGEIAVQLP